MKKQALVTAIFFLFLFQYAGGQVEQSAPSSISVSKMIDGQKYKFDKSTVVKDSTGKQLDFDTWFSFVKTGEYDVKLLSLIQGQSQEFLLYRISAEAIEKNREMREKIKKEKKSLTAGLPVNKFSITDIQGNAYSNESLKGKIVVFNFWFINCAPCVKEIPELNILQEKFKDKDVVFLAVSNIDAKNDIEKFVSKNKFTFNQISMEQASTLGFINSISSFPTYMIVDANGVIRHISSGYSDDGIQTLEKIIEAAL
jgi:peroxiredoxin